MAISALFSVSITFYIIKILQVGGIIVSCRRLLKISVTAKSHLATAWRWVMTSSFYSHHFGSNRTTNRSRWDAPKCNFFKLL